MTDSINLNTVVSVSVGSYDVDCIQIAKDILQGCFKDYYFFQYDEDDYCLLVADKLNFSEGGCYGNNVTVYQFTKIVEINSVPRSVQIPFSGQYGGVDGAGGIQGNSTFNYVDTVENITYKYLEPYIVNSVTVANSDYLVYGSDVLLPHLIQGVENYAFTAFCFTVGIVVFGLCNRVFRRVY